MKSAPPSVVRHHLQFATGFHNPLALRIAVQISFDQVRAVMVPVTPYDIPRFFIR
ncbi:MAG: hypothetical protein IPJ07_11080 [Acidobacteria bacterium]|nr:hypothetical protein [Acidobacteriota bacterium]